MHKTGEFLQLETLPSGDTYGTRLDSYIEGYINMFAVAAEALPNFRSFGFKQVKSMFLVPESNLIWKQRLINQNIPSEKMPKRIEEAIFSYESALADKDMQFILCDSIPDTIDRVIQAKNNEVIWHEDLARVTAKINLDKLNLEIR